MVKELEVLSDGAILTILSDSRRIAPHGMSEGGDGQIGSNSLERDGVKVELPSKFTLPVRNGDVVGIFTPSGGGWGSEKKLDNSDH
jgi:N-methylhydantoinase B/oxoprolinase/acetone carboxylase alpha subunit